MNIERTQQTRPEIEAILASLGTRVEVVEWGRQLKWAKTLVLRVPSERVADALLALELNGFADALAYQSGDDDGDVHE